MCITLMEKSGKIRGWKNLNLFSLFGDKNFSGNLKLGREAWNERTLRIENFDKLLITEVRVESEGKWKDDQLENEKM